MTILAKKILFLRKWKQGNCDLVVVSYILSYHFNNWANNIAHLQEEYENMRQKIEEAANGAAQIERGGDYAAFANTTKSDHPTIIKVCQIVLLFYY